jgi:hypothetical protein
LGSGVGVAVMLELMLGFLPVTDNSFIIGLYYGDLPPYLPHVIIQDLCYIFVFNATSVNLGEFEIQPHRLF